MMSGDYITTSSFWSGFVLKCLQFALVEFRADEPKRPTLSLHLVKLLCEAICQVNPFSTWRLHVVVSVQCAHEQHVRRTLILTLTHTITAYSVSANVVRVRILICVLEVFWFYATLIIFVDNNNNNKCVIPSSR